MRRLQENLERREADQRLVDALAQHDFSGPLYRRFEDELVNYGLAVTKGWTFSGHIFHLTAARGFRLHPTDLELEELRRDGDLRLEFADLTVATALPRFRNRALVRGGWRHDLGASLTTYFAGALVYEFPNHFRRRRVDRRKYERACRREGVVLLPQAEPSSDPAVIALSDMRVRADLTRLRPRDRRIVVLTLVGYSQEEIVELLGETSVRAVEGVLHRWRIREQQRLAREVARERRP